MPAKPTEQPPNDTSLPSETDWERLRDLSDEDIDTSDIPEPTPEQFARAVVRQGLQPVALKQQVTLRLDADVLTWFRSQGRGYQTRINALLRAYMEAQQHTKP
jgi:uncharacterized protein (DUF4415 family)